MERRGHPAWYVRTVEVRERLVGEVCDHCGSKIFPPRDVCSKCSSVTTGIAVEIPKVGPLMGINEELNVIYPNLVVKTFSQGTSSKPNPAK